MPDILLHAMQEFTKGFFRGWQGKRVWCTEDVKNGTFFILVPSLMCKKVESIKALLMCLESYVGSYEKLAEV